MSTRTVPIPKSVLLDEDMARVEAIWGDAQRVARGMVDSIARGLSELSATFMEELGDRITSKFFETTSPLHSRMRLDTFGWASSGMRQYSHDHWHWGCDPKGLGATFGLSEVDSGKLQRVHREIIMVGQCIFWVAGIRDRVWNVDLDPDDILDASKMSSVWHLWAWEKIHWLGQHILMPPQWAIPTTTIEH